VLKVGLTGSIATGKSTVLDMMAAEGVPVIASDDIVHRLYQSAAVAPVERLFPGVTRAGGIDREDLSRRLIAEPERLKELEAVVHPLVRNEIAYFFKAEEGRNAPLAVADIPLLFESGFDYGLDAVIVTTVDPQIQRQRALARPGMSVDKLEAILARQMPQAEKLRRATYVIDTSRSLQETEKDVREVVEKLKANRQT
jgi:dephospho-CoA kinase